MQKEWGFFTSAVSVYFQKAAGILLSYNTINDHRCSAIFAGDAECSLICLHCTSKSEQKKNLLDYKHSTEPLDR